MRRKLISILLIVCVAVTMLIPVMNIHTDEAAAATSFTIRTSMPKLTDKNAKYYYSDLNRFWKAGRLAPDFKKYAGIMDDGKTSGYVWGNCTWWAYSRASEVIGEPLNPNLRGNAGEWWECNKKGKYYPYGSTPKAGAIVVYKTHVAFVEKVVNGQIYVSESGWQTKTYGPSSTDDFFFHYGKPWSSNGTPKGYIYVTDAKSVESEKVSVSYSVKVSVSSLRMRSGPGTGYSNMGVIQKGTHKLQAVSADGEWGQLSSNGYWISLEYTTKVKSSNNKLSSLSVSGGYTLSPSFSASKTAYTVSVPSTVSSIKISASKADSSASISGTGTMSLKTGKNTKTIKVTAENGSVKNYTVTVTRAEEKKVQVKVTELNMRSGPGSSYTTKGKIKPGTYTIVHTINNWGKLKNNGYWISLDYATEVKKSSNNNLKSLSVKGQSISPTFNKSTTSYKVKVANNVSSVTINAAAADSKSSVTGTGKISLKVGTNTAKVVVKAENGSKKTYTVVIERASTYKVKVSVTELNMRSGPGTTYKSKGKIKTGTYVITKTKNGWGKLKKNGYWIKLSYTKRVS